MNVEEIASIEIVDILGRPMNINFSGNGSYTAVQTADFPEGFYVVQIRLSNGKVLSAKFQVVHD